MTSLLTAAIIGAGLATIVLVAYAVPIRRTRRKEAGEPLETPGPEVEEVERTGERTAA